MVNMDTLNQKVDRKTRQLTEKAMAKLDTQIKTLEEGGVKFEKLFNNDAIKYDVLGKISLRTNLEEMIPLSLECFIVS